MGAQYKVDRGPRRLQRGIIKRALRKGRRESRRHEKHVALAQRHLQPLRQLEHHVPRRRRPSGFHKAQVAGGDLGIAGQIELAQMTPLPPIAQVTADMGRLAWVGSRRGVAWAHARKSIMRISPVPLRPR